MPDLHSSSLLSIGQLCDENYSAVFTKITFKADSGASSTYIRRNDQDILRNIRPTTTGPTVSLPDNRQIKCTAIGNLPITTMSSRATQSYIMPDLHSSSLLSIGQLCDEN